MRFLYTLLVLGLTISCGGDEPGIGDNTLRTFEEAQTQYEELEETFTLPLTREAGFPVNGVAVYKGMHAGEFFSGNTTSVTTLDYFADVEFTLDYETGNFTGLLTNFTTNLEGFENPAGELEVSGSIRGTAEMGGDEFGLRFRVNAGNLTQGERTASFDAFTASKGRFLGQTAEAVNIQNTSLFTWTAGPDAGTESGTIGFMHALRQ